MRSLKRARVACGAGIGIAFFAASIAPAFALIHAGDQLQVTVYNHPDLSQKVVVDASESIALPLAGQINVRGMEPRDVAAAIESALDPYLKSEPVVAVLLTERAQSLFISGGPGGVLKYLPGETLAGAIASVSAADAASPQSATGLASLERTRIDLRSVGVVRDGASIGTFDVTQLSANGLSGPKLLPGDTIVFVNKADEVTVRGDVVDPGSVYLAANESLVDAIRRAGGVRDTAATSDVTLARDGATMTLALGDPALLERAHNGDVLTVPTAPRVNVTGYVAKPGPVTLRSNFTLLSAVYEAGGPLKNADLTRVLVVQGGTQTTMDLAALKDGNFSQNPKLADGAIVFLPEGPHRIDVGAVFQALIPILYFLPRP